VSKRLGSPCAKRRRSGASDDEVRLRISLPADGPFFLNHLANAADAWREDFRRCRVLKEFSQGSVYLSANEKMVELDVQWGDGADLENLGVERRADRVISSAKCAQKKITPGPLPRTLVRGVA